MKIRYLDFESTLGDAANIADTAAVIGRMAAGARLTLRGYATLRADGEHIRVGNDVYFGEHATAHIVDAKIGASVADDITVGRYAVVHGCTMGSHVVIGEGSAVMDDARVDDDVVVAADSIVSPGKSLAGGWLYRGVPAKPVRQLARGQVAAIAQSIRSGAPDDVVRSSGLPPMSDGPPRLRADSAALGLRSRASYVAPTARVAGHVEVRDDAGIYFGCVVDANDGRIAIGARTNVQDNSFLITSRSHGELVLGVGVTVGHNVQMGSGTFGDDCLVGMMSRAGNGVIVEPGGCIAAGAWVEPGTVVKAGWIWAGRPARAFRELRPAEREEFARGRDVYVGYGAAYRAGR